MAKTDQKTLALIKEVKSRKAEIAKLEAKPQWKTNCSFSWGEHEGKGSGLVNPVNLQVESSVKNLISMASFLRDKEASYASTAAAFEVDSPPSFTWNTFPVADWIEDIKTRINRLQIASKKKKLEALETRLNAVISPELRAEMELEAITSELG